MVKLKLTDKGMSRFKMVREIMKCWSVCDFVFRCTHMSPINTQYSCNYGQVLNVEEYDFENSSLKEFVKQGDLEVV